MCDLDENVDNLTRASLIDSGPAGYYDQCVRAVIAKAKTTSRDSLNDNLEQLAQTIDQARLDIAGAVAMTCGALVEFGGDPLIALDSVLRRLNESLTPVRAGIEACRVEAQKNDDTDMQEHTLINKYVQVIHNHSMAQAEACLAIPRLSLACIAMMSRSFEARRIGRKQSNLLEAALEFEDYFSECGFLAEMLQVLDDESLVVLCPQYMAGYQVRITGIGDNNQLQTLLADELIGDVNTGWLPGTPPDERVVAAAKNTDVVPGTPISTSIFNLVNWTGLQPNLTVNSTVDGHLYWIRADAIPADIAKLNGTRIVLLGPMPFIRIVDPQRRYSGMEADLKVEQILDLETVKQWLTTIKTAIRDKQGAD